MGFHFPRAIRPPCEFNPDDTWGRLRFQMDSIQIGGASQGGERKAKFTPPIAQHQQAQKRSLLKQVVSEPTSQSPRGGEVLGPENRLTKYLSPTSEKRITKMAFPNQPLVYPFNKLGTQVIMGA